MKKLIITLLAGLSIGLGLGSVARADEALYPLDHFPTEKMEDMASLQRGAKLFVNYCLNCHGAAFVRYNKLQELGLTEQQIKDNLLFSGEKVGDLMRVALDPKQAKAFFGAAPPDLSVIERSRTGERGSGSDYLYTYLRTFYRDDGKATGWNNMVFPSVAMPHVLWELQGERTAKFKTVTNHEGEKIEVFEGFEQVTPGKLDAHQYDEAVGDLVAYMTWMAEPTQGLRYRLGVIVLIFLGVFTFCAWRLNAAYWKDVK